jgi:hypothetical protein
MNARAARGCLEPAMMAIGSGVIQAVFGAANLISYPARRSSNAM